MLTTLKKLLYLLPPGDKLKLFALFCMMLFGTLLEVIGIAIIPVFVSIIASPNMILEMDRLVPLWTALHIDDAGDLMVYGALFLIAVFIIKNLYIIFYKYIQARFIWSRFSMIGSQLFKHYMTAPYEFHLKRNSAELLRNVTQETQYMTKHVMTPFLKLSMDVVLIFGIFAMLLWAEPLITLGVFVLLGGGGGLFLKAMKKKTRHYGKRGQVDRGQMIKSVNEGLGGFKDARILNREGWFQKRFKHHIRSYGKSQTFKELAFLSTKPVIETIAVTGMLLIGLVLFWQGRGLETVVPVLTLFGAAIVKLMPALQESAKAFTNLRYYSYTVEPIYDDSRAIKLTKIKNNVPGPQTVRFEDVIRFEQVSYMYPDARYEAVKELSLVIPKGQAVGFIGSSGAGKTTLVDLLLGLLTPQSGKITVDGRDIHNNLSGWQRNIGYIPQFIYLADDTIRNNIAFGLPDEEIDDDRIQSALEVAQLSELMKTLPEGVNTVIGERGTRLSGGQRQRIGIARALYHNPQVLIMDEATSALDNVTESFVIEAIDRLKGDRTIIMIAHRLTTVQGCDKLFQMKNGKVSEVAGINFI